MGSQRFLEALGCRNRGRPPVWLMRQAGRYLPEYRALRERYAFEEMCRQPDLIAQVTQMPIKRFGVDAAILFSDILLILETFGRTVRFVEGVGPVVTEPIRNGADLSNMPEGAVEETLNFVAAGVRQLKQELDVPLIGFCGAPFTVASYLIEGGSSRDFAHTKAWMYRDPVSFSALLDRISDASIRYLKMQVEAGVDAIQIFDSWANVLTHHQFSAFSLAYFQRIVDAIQPMGVPVILFCRGSSFYAEQLAQLKPAGLSLDWNGSLPQIRRSLGSDVALQGNLDPQLLFAPTDVVQRETQRLLDEMSGDPGFILGLGHGVLPKTPLESVSALVDSVKAIECRVGK